MKQQLENFINEVERIPDMRFFGRISSIKGLLAECSGLGRVASVGSRCKIISRNGKEIAAEVVGFREDIVLLMPFGELDGVGVGCKVWMVNDEAVAFPCEQWKGRVINAMGEPIDGKGALPKGNKAYPYRNSPPPAHSRQRVKGKIDLGVRALNTFLTCCRGQRMGIFAGSGVGKSMLISMLTKFCQADIKVIGLIGERGREVQEFLQDYLGEEGLKNAVVIVATGDESALMRRQAAYMTMVVAEYFRDIGRDVLCMMDSVTRFAMAQREIGLSAGEPPTTKGYTPTVFAEMPKLLERAGPGVDKGSITGIFTILVEGDDHNEPISDAARGILDGHIVMDRIIAERGRFPAINILRSISRTMPGCNSDEENALVIRAKTLLSTYNDMAELIRLGAYKKGSDQMVDEAIKYYTPLDEFLKQKPGESSSLADGYAGLKAILE
ncbi:MAG: fliI [Rickettsiaceae bacterium]|jgi:flagellum-specific ATP synthase|nr:fliI [Rickettsiaceae bacterium]